MSDRIKLQPPAKKSSSYSSRRLDFGQELTDNNNFFYNHDDNFCQLRHASLYIRFGCAGS